MRGNAQRAMYDLSTSHVPRDQWDDPDFGDLRSQEHEHGWIVFVTPSAEDLGLRVSAWLLPIHDAAVRDGAMLINFDSDGWVDTRFDTYE